MTALSLFCATRRSHEGLMELNDTCHVSLTSSLFHGFVFVVVVITKNPDLHKKDFGNGSKVLNAFLPKSEYFNKTFIQNLGRVVVAKIYLRIPSFAMSSSLSSCYTGKVNSPG